MFTPQFEIPEAGNPYYNTIKTGGYNPCILGNPKNRNPELNVLANCVGYATGRFNEIGGYGRCKYLGNTNARNFIDVAKKQGLEISQEPTLGGVMVWDGGSKGLGHVAVVEYIYTGPLAGHIITSESEYYGKQFVAVGRNNRDGDWRTGCKWMTSEYKYMGCIKNPAVKEEEEDEMSYETFKEYMAKYEAEQRQKPADGYAVPALQWAKDVGLMVGGATGNQMPQATIKREDVAVMFKAYSQITQDAIKDAVNEAKKALEAQIIEDAEKTSVSAEY